MTLTGVIMANGPGISTPSTFFGLAVDMAMEPTMKDHLTPLGQRQQYLIGTELRNRYCVDTPLLETDYNVNQVKMQTPFVGKSILSMQAQMMGFFPSSNTNDLTAWQ